VGLRSAGTPTTGSLSSAPAVEPDVATAARGQYRPATAADAERTYLRGSYLLLAGRIIAILLNLASQILTVRFLAKADYGAFAYVLALVSMGSSLVQCGTGKALPRLVAIQHENREHDRTFGTIALATYAVWGAGVVFMLLLLGFRGVVGGSGAGPKAATLLLILLALGPIQAYTTVLTTILAVFVGARAVFFRRHVLGPGLKLLAVSAVALFHGDVVHLAWGYLAGGVVGLWACGAILLAHWREHGLLPYLRPRRMRLAPRELFGSSLPLLTTDLMVIMRDTVIIIILARFHSASAVADYRAVLPIATLNMLVYEAFNPLFVPVASRMRARLEWNAIGELYWKTSMWITVLSMPILAVTCALAEPLTVLLFGDRYAGAGSLLAVLAAGHFVNAALGFNWASLNVHGRIRVIAVNDLLSAAGLLAMGFLLIPRYGALGAALTLSGALVLQNVLNNLGLWWSNTGIRLIHRQAVRIYLLAIGVLTAVLLVQRVFEPPLYVSVVMIAVLSLAVVRLTRHALKPTETFPELLRIPFVRQLMS
jgi:O-antigen/teichoic acid export membrane protein